MMIDNNEENAQIELDLLKEQATKMGITFHPNIGLDKLQAKVDNFIPGQTDAPVEVKKEPYKLNTALPERIIETKTQLLDRKRKEATRMVRVRIACMNPNKKEWSGEILTVSNSLVGSIKKYIPFNNEEGWHIPYMMYLHLKERECQLFIKKKNSRGRQIAVPKMIKEFSVELLPDLTQQEMKDLAQRQAMAAGRETSF